jgi:hypothetical protein
MLVQENYKDSVSFERVQRTLYQLSKGDDLKDWRKKLVYRRLLRLTQYFMQKNSESFTLFNGSYIGINGGVLELSFRVPSDFRLYNNLSPEDVLFAAESMRDFIYIVDRFGIAEILGNARFQNVDQFSLDFAVVIPVDFVQNYNN